MRSRVLHPLIVGFSVSLWACGGDDGPTGPGSQTAATIQLANPTLVFTTALQSATVSYTVRDASGATIQNPAVTFESFNPAVASVTASGVVTGLRNGSATIRIRSGVATADAQVSVDIVPEALADGLVRTISGPRSSIRYYTFEVPPGAADRLLLVRLVGEQGDADLYLRFGERVGESDWDCGSTSLLFNLDRIEACAVFDPQPGTWHVAVHGYSPYTDIALAATIGSFTTLTDETPAVDLAGDRLALRYFRIEVPAGAGLDISTSGGTGDADLFAAPQSIVSFPLLYEAPCASVTDTATESCSIADPQPGFWAIVLFGFDAFSGVQLLADVVPGS